MQALRGGTLGNPVRCNVPAAWGTAFSQRRPWRKAETARRPDDRHSHCYGGVSERWSAQPWTARGNSRRPAAAAGPAGPAPLVAVEGDTVSLHFICRDKTSGEVIESTAEEGTPVSFEIGAGDAIANPLFKAFDGAVRGLAVGEGAVIEASGGEWRPELLFTVPRDHAEVARLEGRYKNQGGLQAGALVELQNGQVALVVEVAPEAVRLDANSMAAGRTLVFELSVLGITRGGGGAGAGERPVAAP